MANLHTPSSITCTLTWLSLFGIITAQNPQTASFTDPDTGITFQRFFGARTGFGFGIALPVNPSTDFIGQISCPISNENGYGGVGMTDDMEGPLLIAAWPNGNGGVVSTFRVSQDEDESPPTVNGNFKISVIQDGTFSDGSNMKFTFLCQNCISASLGFSAADTGGTVQMGWGLSSERVSNIGSASASMGFHDVGFGAFDADMDAARSPLFGEWALMAGINSNGSAQPIPVSAANPLTGGGTNFDDDDDDDGGDDEGEDEGDDDD